MGGVTNKRYPGILNSRIRLLSSWYHLLASLLLSRDTTGSHAVTCRFASQLQFISQALRWCREHNESRNKMFHWRPQWFLIQKFQKAIILEQKWEVPGLLMGGRFLGAHINQIHFSSPVIHHDDVQAFQSCCLYSFGFCSESLLLQGKWYRKGKDFMFHVLVQCTLQWHARRFASLMTHIQCYYYCLKSNADCPVSPVCL